LAAARWFREAVISTWPAQRLGALMSSLECLLVPFGATQGKGSRIGRNLPPSLYPPGTSRKAVRKWLQNLYLHRNSALHAGVDYLEDLDVDRLEDLTREVIEWAIWHLSPMHAHGELDTACVSLDQVLTS
jgi:hypothetical protein